RNIEHSEAIFKNLEAKYRLNSIDGEINYKNYIKINNTNISPDKTAAMIKERFGL
ncbi:MAG: family ATPase, partial [Clostridia bacterium]|nr:family ATPase [Clostridia bacterium]